MRVLLLVNALTVQDPGLPLDRLTPAIIEAYTDRHIADATASLERLLRTRGPRTVENALRPYDDLRSRLNALRIVSLLRQFHPDSVVRAACARAESQLNAFGRGVQLDRRVYAMIAGVDTTRADAETRFYLAELRAAFRRAGVDRDDTARARIAALRAALTGLQQRFEANITQDTTSIAFESASDLAGVPSDWVALQRRGPRGEIVVPSQDLPPVTRQARSGATRARALMALWSGAPANHALLDSLLRTRYALATLLGYRSWADYQLEEYMVGSADSARAFLDALRALSAESVRRELAERRQALAAAGDSGAASRPWLSVSDYGFGARGDAPGGGGGAAAALRPYFPYSRVRDGLFALAHDLMGLEFRSAPDLPVWHPSVEPYRVYDGGRLIAKVYLDVHARPGKTAQGAAAHLFRAGVRDRVITEAAITAGVVRETPGNPGLLGPQAVGTLFHEFGHLVHFLVAVRPWFWTSGLPPEGDFREVPSVLFEQWAHDTTVLRRIAQHYQTGEAMPDSLLARMAATPTQGSLLAQQWRARMSLALHDRPPGSIDSVVRATFSAAQPPGVDVRLPDAEIHPEDTFWHLSGYEASYYTYLWSGVIARDILSRFDHGLLDTTMVRAYRREILEPGGSRSAKASLEAFLGRPFAIDAWARALQSGGP